MSVTESPKSNTLTVGDALPDFTLDLTSTMVVAGAIASRDFMPAHHDPEFAKGQGAPDIFLNILTTNGYIARFVTDWAGPDVALPVGVRYDKRRRRRSSARPAADDRRARRLVAGSG